jgi:hypothetical protein
LWSVVVERRDLGAPGREHDFSFQYIPALNYKQADQGLEKPRAPEDGEAPDAPGAEARNFRMLLILPVALALLGALLILSGRAFWWGLKYAAGQVVVVFRGWGSWCE